MILVLAGTKDGREIAEYLTKQGYSVLVSVTSSYGGQLVASQGLAVHASILDEQGLYELITSRNISYVIDATHPYALNVSLNAMAASNRAKVPYVRYERPGCSLPKYDKLETVLSHEEAAKKAAQWGKTIFLTTGSRTLKIYKHEPLLKDARLIARVLPDGQVLKECLDLGFTPADIIAMQGPFSQELNRAMFKAVGADVVVTKNSGQIGGSDAKFAAAIELGIRLVVVDRPSVAYDRVVSSMKELENCLTRG